MMRPQNNAFLVFSSAGMLLSAYYACTSFIFTAFNMRPIALSASAITLFIAALTTSCTPSGWRRVFSIGFHLLAFLLVFLYQCHDYLPNDIPYWSIRWVPEFISAERTAADLACLFLIALCTCILWFCGMRLITQPTDQTTISNRFDAGLGFLLFLLLVKLAMASKGAALSEMHSATRFIIAYFILGLFSMGIARNNDGNRGGTISPVKGAGIALTFAVALLVLGGGFLLLFLPEFQNFAETGAGLLKTISRPVEPIIIAALHLFFGRASWDQAPEGAGSAGSPTIPQTSAGEGTMALLAPFLVIGLTIAVVIICAIVLQRLFSWLFSKPPTDTDRGRLRHFLLAFILAVRQLFLDLRERFIGRQSWPFHAARYYQKLLIWGQYSGLGQSVSETPKEYASRLGCHFPEVDNEIQTIVHLHDKAIYGCEPITRQQTDRAKMALKKLRTSRLWWARVKMLSIGNRM